MGGNQAMSGRVVAGLGCRAGCPAEQIVDVVREAAARAGRDPAVLAAPHFKQGEQGLEDAAHRLGLPLLFIGADALAAAQAACVTRSTVVERAVGVASVAEGSALAACGPGGRLLLARLARGGATCALAEAAR